MPNFICNQCLILTISSGVHYFCPKFLTSSEGQTVTNKKVLPITMGTSLCCIPPPPQSPGKSNTTQNTPTNNMHKMKNNLPRMFRAARSLCTIDRSSRYIIPWTRTYTVDVLHNIIQTNAMHYITVTLTGQLCNLMLYYYHIIIILYNISDS